MSFHLKFLVRWTEAKSVKDMHAVLTVAPAISATDQNLSEFTINCSSLQRYHTKYREDRSRYLEAEFKTYGKLLIIHWEGKLTVYVTGDEKVDRLPNIVSCDGVDQLQAVPQLTNSTGQAISDAINQTINEWNSADDIKAFSFDTTSANTGRHNSACTLLEAKFGHDALYLAHRHHIHEIFEEVFSSCFGPSSSRKIQLF